MNYKDKSIFKELYYQPYKRNTIKLCDYAKDNINLVKRLGLIRTLPLHDGCVNTLCWNESGNLLLSGSDDQHLVVTNGHTYNVCHNHHTSHRANIFSAKFLPACSDQYVVSCSGDGTILLTNLEYPSTSDDDIFSCHSGTTYEVITIPHDPNTFISCGEDGTVRWFDRRVKTKCLKPQCKEDILILHQRAVTALSINPAAPHQLAIGSSDSTVRIFDRRMLSTATATDTTTNPKHSPMFSFSVPELEERTYRITSLMYSPDGQEMLVSYSSDHLYLFGINERREREFVKKTPAKSHWSKFKCAAKRVRRSPPPVRRLRLRGDWSDTGPDARPERDATNTVNIGQARPQLQATLMERMTNVLFRMLNDPLTRAALSAGGEDSLENNASADPSQEQGAAATQPISDASELRDLISDELTDTRDEDDAERNQIASRSVGVTTEEPSTSSVPQDPEEVTINQSQEAPTSTNELPAANNSELNTLQNKLLTLRHGFIEKHGSEPSVSLRYSDQSSSSSTIRLGVGDELNRSYPDCDTPSGSKPLDADTNMCEASDETNQPSTSTQSPPETAEPEYYRSGSPERSGADVDLDFSDSEDEKEVASVLSNVYQTNESKKRATERNCEPHVKQKYVGHRNARTMIKEATFWGNDFVMSGSDCGHIFIWDRVTARLEMLLQADNHVVNCLQPHPTLPLLATSGIDHDVKLWSPILEENSFDAKMAEDLMKRNEVMLEETRDTITVPAAFMIRMLACLNQIRRTGSLARTRRRQQEPPSEPQNKSRRSAP